MRIDEKQIAELRALYAAASDGPWETAEGNDWLVLGRGRVLVADCDYRVDAALVIAMHAALSELLDAAEENERLRARLERAEDQRDAALRKLADVEHGQAGWLKFDADFLTAHATEKQLAEENARLRLGGEVLAANQRVAGKMVAGLREHLGDANADLNAVMLILERLAIPLKDPSGEYLHRPDQELIDRLGRGESAIARLAEIERVISSGSHGLSYYLDWIAGRLVHIYGESGNVDFVLAAKRYAGDLARLGDGTDEDDPNEDAPDEHWCTGCGACHQPPDCAPRKEDPGAEENARLRARLALALDVVEAVRAHCTVETPPEIMAALAALESPPEGTEGADTPAPVEPEPGSPGDASGAPDGGTCSHDVRTGVSTGASGGIWTCALCGTSWVDDDAVPERGHHMTPHSNYRPRDECVPIRCRHCGIPEPDQDGECEAPAAKGEPSTLQPRTRYAIESPHGIEWEDR